MRKYPSAKDLAKITRAGRYAVGHGAYMQVSPDGDRSWIFRYRIGAKSTHMGMGSCAYVTLQEARDKAIDYQRQRLAGLDPLTEKRRLRAQRVPVVDAVTFQDAALQFIINREPSWRNGASSQQWRASLATHVFPQIGHLSVSDITSDHVVTALQPIWQATPETARRVRNRVELVLSFAIAKKWRTGDNPAAWSVLKHLLPEHNGLQKRHMPAVPYKELPTFVQRLQGDGSVVARCILFTILTAARASEAGGCKWAEIDGDTWVVPAPRTKRNREHRVPLSAAAQSVLNSLPRMEEYVFPATRKAYVMSPTMLLTLKRMGRSETIHGFRSAFRTWASECTKYPDIVAELCLAHQVGGAVERAYRRGDLINWRRELLEDWAKFLIPG